MPQVSNKHRAWGRILLHSLLDSGQPSSCPESQCTHTRAFQVGVGLLTPMGLSSHPAFTTEREGSLLTFPDVL